MYPDLLLATLSYPDATPDRAIRSGVALASRFGGGLTLLTLTADIPTLRNPLANALIRMDQMAAIEEARSAASAKLEALCGRIAAEDSGVDLRVQTLRARVFEEADAVAAAARTHDLCLIPLGLSVLADRSLAEAVLFGSGRPLLAYPDTLEIAPGGGPGRVTIAWDGSARAARAVADAMPLLLRAREVKVFIAVGEKPAAQPGSARDLLRHLDAHGVPAGLDEVPAEGRGIGDLLTDHVQRTAADLLVMGGFGHARLREFVLGGATDAMLQEPPCPVLMSH